MTRYDTALQFDAADFLERTVTDIVAFPPRLIGALAILAAANVLAIDLLIEWVGTAVSYLPAFIAGLAVIILGFIVAGFIGDAVTRARVAGVTPPPANRVASGE